MCRQLLLFACVLFLFPACVGKKKHLEALQNMENEHQALLQMKTEEWTGQLQNANQNISDLRLQLAERKGENNALVAMQDKLEARIEALKEELETQGLQSQSNTQSLSKELQKKESEIARLKGLLEEIDSELEKHLTTLGSLANDLRVVLQAYPEDQYSIQTSNVRVRVNLSEKLLFKARSTSSVTPQTTELMADLAAVFQRYPSMNLNVLGHTDNKPPRNKGYKDNWNVSVIRAAIITRLLVDEHDFSPNQILAAGKGEFAPRTSNETEDGRAQNRRIELNIKPREEDMARVLQRITEQK